MENTKQEKNESSKLPSDMDPECIPLVEAMNIVKGISTFESCCGHGNHPFRIFFSAESLEVLPPLLYWFDKCHSGVDGWRVEVSTDCSMSPATFMATSTTKGEKAYAEANEIAEIIINNDT